MSKPQSEERLPRAPRPAVRRAAPAPPSVGAAFSGAAGAAVALSLPALLAACGGASTSSAGGGGGRLHRHGDARVQRLGRRAQEGLRRGLRRVQGDPGLEVKVNTVDHNTFQEQINNYLQGSPDDVFTWFAGYRMRFFAAKGLAGDISDVWDKIGAGFTDAFKKASTGDDGKQYFVPLYNYPWAVFYRKACGPRRATRCRRRWTS